jgi:hypothetical protein
VVCRDGPRWKIRTAEAAVLDAASALAWVWPTAGRVLYVFKGVYARYGCAGSDTDCTSST